MNFNLLLPLQNVYKLTERPVVQLNAIFRFGTKRIKYINLFQGETTLWIRLQNSELLLHKLPRTRAQISTRFKFQDNFWRSVAGPKNAILKVVSFQVLRRLELGKARESCQIKLKTFSETKDIHGQGLLTDRSNILALFKTFKSHASFIWFCYVRVWHCFHNVPNVMLLLQYWLKKQQQQVFGTPPPPPP